MKIGPKFKIARRLGAPVFEKTQTAKYSLSLARKERSDKFRGGRPKSEFGRELIEKQKVRFTYGVTEKQLRNYVNKSLHAANPAQKLFSLLESRVDNVLYRAGFLKTRSQARQAASHGHILVNGRRITIPSILLTNGDKISIRTNSSGSPLFTDVAERMKTLTLPQWLKADPATREVVVEGEPSYVPSEQLFDLGATIEFYSR